MLASRDLALANTAPSLKWSPSGKVGSGHKPSSSMKQSITSLSSVTASPPAPSVASTDRTAFVPEASASPTRKRTRSKLEEDALVIDDRPLQKPRTESYVPPAGDAAGILGWFLLPFVTFVRGFKEGMRTSAESSSASFSEI